MWRVVFADERVIESKDASWADFSDLVMVDSVNVHLSTQLIRSIMVFCGEHVYGLDTEEPSQCFGFHRWRSSPDGVQEWLYSAFGFFREEERVILQVQEKAGRVVLQSRYTPFEL